MVSLILQFTLSHVHLYVNQKVYKVRHNVSFFKIPSKRKTSGIFHIWGANKTSNYLLLETSEIVQTVPRVAKVVALHSSLKMSIYDNLSPKEAFGNNKRAHTSIRTLRTIGNKTPPQKPCYGVGGAK